MRQEEVQRIHYDEQAVYTSLGDASRRIGSKGLWPSVRAPYQFVESWLASHDISGKKVLDYGCGHGIHSIFPALNGAFVTGIDISQKQVELAKRRALECGVEDRTSFQVGNCEWLNFKDDSFDIVFSGGTLSCIDLRKAYSELARVIKPDGYVIIVDTLGHNPFVNLNRRAKLKRGLKTRWSVDHILKLPDLYAARSCFGKRETFFFDLATLPLAFANELFSGRFTHSNGVWMKLVTISQRIDRFLLSLTPFQKYAFKFVCILSRPGKVR